MTSASSTIEVYWLPGCANCLRVKEFVEQTGRTFVDVNLVEEPAAAQRLLRFGVRAPAVVAGDRAVRGLDLAEVARLIGYDYQPPEILDPAVLKKRFDTALTALCRYTRQIPAEWLERRLPGSGWSVRFLVAHAGTVMRRFVEAHGAEIVDSFGAPPRTLAAVGDKEELLNWAAGTVAMVDDWWVRSGHDDPLDRVLETTWGFRTLHEVLARSVWHTARHTGELASWMSGAGIAPDGPLTAADTAGLVRPGGNVDADSDECWSMT